MENMHLHWKIGVPAVIGKNGVEKIIEPALMMKKNKSLTKR